MFYLIILLSLFLLSFIQLNNGTKISIFEKIVLFLCFWLISGFAYETGVDWRIYKDVYDSILPIDQAIRYNSFSLVGMTVEPAYALLGSVIKVFTDDYYVFQCVLLLICSIFFFKALNKYTTYLYAGLLLYFGCVYLILNMSGIRQALAFSIFFYALSYIRERKFWKYVMWIILAGCFHVTAFLLIPLYFFLRHRFSSKTLYILVGVCVVIYLLQISVTMGILKIVSELSHNPILIKLLMYLTRIEDGSIAIRGVSPKFIVYILFVLIIIYRRNKLEQRNYFAPLFINLYVFFIIVICLLWDSGEIVERINLYFLGGIIILLPELMMSFNRFSNRLVLLCIICMIAFISNSTIMLEKPMGISYNPYQNYLIHSMFDIPSTGEERLDIFSEQVKK